MLYGSIKMVTINDTSVRYFLAIINTLFFFSFNLLPTTVWRDPCEHYHLAAAIVCLSKIKLQNYISLILLQIPTAVRRVTHTDYTVE